MEEIKIDCVYNYKGSTHSYLTVRIMDVDNFEIYSSHGDLIEKYTMWLIVYIFCIWYP